MQRVLAMEIETGKTMPVSAWAAFIAFLRLGLTSFGGPTAHPGYFRAEFVTRRRWLSEHSYADLIALCQFLPGPLLQAEVVPNGWISNQTFLAGYGAAQAVPGPLFTFAAFLGAAMNGAPNGVFGGWLLSAVP